MAYSKESFKETCEMCLTKMFEIVGEEYPNEELTSLEDWYTKRTWTPQQEEGFKKWMDALLKKRHRHLNKHTREKEIAWFNLMWGWKTDPQPWEDEKPVDSSPSK